ncbi:hypothetical protein LOZ53_001030 [Ophidiomyces ophidiicola]|nr:hypothetical protein LOZ55_004185 [Ophidiomyces ophidiicola]KAI1996429.1 hypothetical protein LOZ53_001030 [Ophidiomyces ophidiicola]KAI2001065.1 hypothetical protein LOZ51_001356 [Ophidiomyces ophidiicola]
MSEIFANIEHLADLPLYKVEKPYGALLSDGNVYFSQGHRLDNIEFTEHRRRVVDVANDPAYTLPKNGFQIFKQESKTMWDVSTIDLARRHREEMAELNDETPRDQVDVLNPLVVEPRARGAHNDVTLKSGPDIFFNHLLEGQEDYLKPGYRVRIMK